MSDREQRSAAPVALEPSVIFPDEWEGLEPPPREWVIEDTAPKGTLTLFSGDGGLGKSLLCQMLQTSAALGEPWLGVNVRQCASVGFYCEDDAAELQRRQDSIMDYFGRPHSDLRQNMAVISRVANADNALAEYTPNTGQLQSNALLAGLEEFVQMHGAELVVIDPAVAVYPGEEIRRRDVRQFCDLLKAMAHRTGAAVILTAHPSRAGLSSGDGLSGSTDWNNAVRSRLYLRKAGEDDDCERIITTPKSNYGPTDRRIELVWQDGLFVRSNGPTDAVDRMQQRTAETVFLDCLGKAGRQGINLSPSRNAASYAPRHISRMPESGSFKPKALEGAMYNLLSQGRIRNVTYGPPSKGFTRLEVAE